MRAGLNEKPSASPRTAERRAADAAVDAGAVEILFLGCRSEDSPIGLS